MSKLELRTPESIPPGLGMDRTNANCFIVSGSKYFYFFVLLRCSMVLDGSMQFLIKFRLISTKFR